MQKPCTTAVKWFIVKKTFGPRTKRKHTATRFQRWEFEIPFPASTKVERFSRFSINYVGSDIGKKPRVAKL